MKLLQDFLGPADIGDTLKGPAVHLLWFKEIL